jgi:NAD(P)-dependent dehydrogenase (short-subunit alcohol dehydrogenase family)
VPVDIAEPGSVSEAFDAVTAAFGQLDGLFNNAGVAQRNRTGQVEDISACDEDWCRTRSQSLMLLLWAGHSGSASSCHPWLVSQARSAVGWFGSCLRS